MPELKLNDNRLLRLIDKDKLSQAEAARRLGVSRQRVSQRLFELRGHTTRAVVAGKVEAIVDRKINAMEQLLTINEKANAMLDAAESDPDLSLKVMAEIRGQLKLQLEIYNSMFDLQNAQEFMNETLNIIDQVEPEVRREIIRRINERRSVRSALCFH